MAAAEPAQENPKKSKKKGKRSGKQLTEEQTEELRDIFRVLDKKKDGYLKLSERATTDMMDGSVVGTESAHFKRGTPDEEKIGIDEFVEGMSEKLILRDTREEIRQAFLVFDKEGNGFINAVELRRVMAGLGIPLSNKQIDTMLKQSDLDGDGQVNYEEYIRILLE